jgi:hypothetical protein
MDGVGRLSPGQVSAIRKRQRMPTDFEPDGINLSIPSYLGHVTEIRVDAEAA